ncbi:MAG: porin [Candidatus Hydrogenedentes bacterium]|nr:porin [Candidatus Hydrogenedentota bacterium]
MSSAKTLKVLGCVMVCAVLMLPGWASAQTEREKELMLMIEALKERVEALEKKAAEAPPAEAASPELSDRVEKIESTLAEEEKKSATDFRAFWKEGLNFETEDGTFKLKIGGRIQHDWAWFDTDDSLEFRVDFQDGTEFRRSRLFVSGDIYENIFFKAEYDFATGAPEFKDVYVGMSEIPYIGNVQIGQFKEPFGMDQLRSDNYLTFMERPMSIEAFTPDRQTGAMLFNTALDERMTWGVGIFRDVDNFGAGSDDGGYNVTGRVTGLPYYKEEGRKLLHLGAAYSHRNPDGDVRYRTRPEAHLSPIRLVDTLLIDADDVDEFGLESAFVYGPFSMQGEYLFVDVDRDGGAGSVDFDGWYLQASYFLTGEHMAYKTDAANFDKIKPKNNFNIKNRTWGAWEVALRYSTIDLDDGPLFPWFGFPGVSGGEEDNWTLGLNWYLNPNTKFMFNYVRANSEHVLWGDEDVNVLQTRFQVFF